MARTFSFLEITETSTADALDMMYMLSEETEGTQFSEPQTNSVLPNNKKY